MIQSRRHILLAGGIAAIAVALGYGLWPARPLDALSQRLAALFPEVAAAAATIRRSSAVAAWGGDRAALAKDLFGSALAARARDRPEATLDALARAVDRDFQDGRLATVDGWTLSETEARLIAFMALSEG